MLEKILLNIIKNTLLVNMRNKIKNFFFKLFRRKTKELSFIDTPIKVKTTIPQARGKFNDKVNYYSRLKNY